ncbi:MAG: VWA domain-containing protein [Deltaproteobacteria bacterium]|jgi:uncharacterized protein (TIGR03503 family)|nr:VWA domain-containing protein [Deltaproteobacteria bacterium]
MKIYKSQFKWLLAVLGHILMVIFVTTGVLTVAFAEDKKTEEHSDKKIRSKQRDELNKFLAQKTSKATQSSQQSKAPELAASVEAQTLLSVANEHPVQPELENNQLSQPIQTNAPDELLTSGIEIILLLDSSRSMTRTDPQRLREQGTKLLLSFLDKNDKIGIYHFGHEVKQVMPLQPLSKLDSNALEKLIHEIPTDGNFTDISLAVSKVLENFRLGDEKAMQAVILLSDGKQDASPSRGAKEELLNQLFNHDLINYRKNKIKLYSIAFSNEADREFLEKLAQKTGGISYFTPDVNTLHLKFSDLFLTLKRPQVVELENNLLNIDAGIDEVTFYINHVDDLNLHPQLIDPAGEIVGSANVPFGFKWFKGKLFDLITVRNPLVGTWQIEGIKNTKGSFATLITDLKLQTKMPDGPFKKGDQPLLYARFLQNGKLLVGDDLLKDVLFFSYKIVAEGTGEIVSEGDLNDLGEDGDTLVKDGLYTTTLNLKQVGKFKCVVIARSPTFVRQQILAFDVLDSYLQLSTKQLDGEEFFEVKLDEAIQDVQNLRVVLFVRDTTNAKVYPFQLSADTADKRRFKIAKSQVIAANIKDVVVYAKVKGKTAAGTVIDDISNVLNLKAIKQASAQPAPSAAQIAAQELGEKIIKSSSQNQPEQIKEEDIFTTQPVSKAATVVEPEEKTEPSKVVVPAKTETKIDFKFYILFVWLVFSFIAILSVVVVLAFYYLKASDKLGFKKLELSFDFSAFMNEFPIRDKKREAGEVEFKILSLLKKLKPAAEINSISQVQVAKNQIGENSQVQAEETWSLGDTKDTGEATPLTDAAAEIQETATTEEGETIVELKEEDSIKESKAEVKITETETQAPELNKLEVKEETE